MKLTPLHMLTISFIFSCQIFAENVNSQEQWPMFGGPNGNAQITTSHSPSTQWSVRTGKNIKWVTNLPAGGQSGITVWEDKLFITINPPLETPKYKILDKNFKQVENLYKNLYKKTISNLENKNDHSLKKLNDDVDLAQIHFSAFTDDYKVKFKKVMNNRDQFQSQQWKTLKTSQSTLLQFVNSQTAQLSHSYQQYISAKQSIQKKGMGKNIILYCLDSNSGNILWTRKVDGTTPAMYNYTFSDATSPTPVTDGKYVWVVNAAGGMASFTMNGRKIWSRKFSLTKNAPFNKQYDTLMYNDIIFNVEPKVTGDTLRVDNWNYLHAFDKHTGKRLWVSDDALTHYSTPVFSHTKNGIPAIMIGRGGPHSVPEKPVGLSLVDLRKQTQGKSLWQWKAPIKGTKSYGGTEIQLWDKQKAYWLQGNKFNTFEIFQIDSSTGAFMKKHNLSSIKRYSYNTEKRNYTLEKKLTVKAHIDRQPYTQVVVRNKLYYMVRYQPYIAYHDLDTGENIHLEIPTEIDKTNNKVNRYIWKTPQHTDQLNSQGQKHNTEERALGDGTQKAFLGTPIVVNNKIYFTNAHGLTYVIDTEKPFGPDSLIAVNDLGEKGETVSLNSMAYSNGKLFHRSLKSIVCIDTL